jgi:hypothetical protein
LSLAALTLFPAATAHAQDKRPSGGQQIGSHTIVQSEAVQKELELTDDQRAALKDLPNRVQKKMAAAREKLRNLQEAERREKMRELRANFAAEFPKALAEILTPAQQKRLRQLQLQYAGGLAFSEADVVKDLALTKEQEDRIDQAVKTGQAATLEAYRRHGETDKARAEAADARKKMFADVDAVLKPDQAARWREMIGKPFAFPDAVRPQGDLAPVVAATPKEKPGLTKGSRAWIDDRIDTFQLSEAERAFERIGWAPDLREALRLAKQRDRPVYIFNFSGRIELGRC